MLGVIFMDVMKQYITVAELSQVKMQLQEVMDKSVADGTADIDSAMIAAQITLIDRLIVKAQKNKGK
jgi:hypothetical protein